MAEREPAREVFVGREAELSRLAEVLARVRTGQAWLVTIEGESGIGKTALIRQVLTLASEFTVFSARGAAVESDLEYGIVQQLLRRVDPEALGGYPLLRGAIGNSSPFSVGAQLLGVVGGQPAEKPLAIVIDDAQWADRRSVEALTFMFRRLTVDPVLVLVVFQRHPDRLDEPKRRMLASIEHRLRLPLAGLALSDVAPLASALGIGPLPDDAVQRLHEGTGGHALYLQTVLSEGLAPTQGERLQVPSSLAVAIADQLAALPPPSRAMLEMLAVANVRLPLALLGDAAGVVSPSAAIDAAVVAGLVDWWPAEASCPVALRHGLQRDAIYASIPATTRRALHARAVSLVDETSAWGHQVAALDGADERLADQLETVSAAEAAGGHLQLAATHLLWAAEISPARPDRERRLLTAANHLMVSDEARGLQLRPTVQAAAPSPLRSCVLGTMAFAAGQLGDAELRFAEALAQARDDPAAADLAAVIASRLAGTYTLLGQGAKVIELGRWAVETGALDAAADSTTRTLIAIGTSQIGGARDGLSALGYLATDAARIDPVHVDGVAFRGVFQLLAGELGPAIGDLTTSLRMVRDGATLTLGLRAYSALAMAQYLSGQWDQVLLTAEQGFSAVAIHERRYELPFLHLAAGCVLATRGAAGDAERHATLAERAADALDYGQERLYAAMARALVCQASGDCAGMARALGPWHNEANVDGRSRLYGVLWRPLLVEGLIGSGQFEQAVVAFDRLQAQGRTARYLTPALAWLEGWLAEVHNRPELARQIYQRGEDADTGDSPLYSARLSLAHGRLLRRTGARRAAVERLRRASALFSNLRAQPFVTQTEEELSACGLTRTPSTQRPILAMTARETEVAHLVGRGLTNGEVAAELFVTPKAVAYHLGNIYAKLGLTGRQELRRVLARSRELAPT